MSLPPTCPSLRQMQQGEIDLQKAEDEANARISHVNEQKVAIVEEFLHFMKVSVSCRYHSSLLHSAVF